MTLYGSTSRKVFPAINGYIGLNRGSSQFQVNRFPNSAIPENTVAPLFDDLMLYANKNPRQGLYYQIEGGTKVTFEWYMGRSAQLEDDQARLSQSIYHFTVAYDSAVPNTFVYTYYSVGNSSAAVGDEGVNGASAAVGLQGGEFCLDIRICSGDTFANNIFLSARRRPNAVDHVLFPHCADYAGDALAV